MKISLKQLETSIKGMRNNCAKQEREDIIVDISITDGDPGNGVLLSALVMEVSASEYTLERDANLKYTAKYELFDKCEKVDPIGTINIVHKFKG
jgi:hypothetical protein